MGEDASDWNLAACTALIDKFISYLVFGCQLPASTRLLEAGPFELSLQCLSPVLVSQSQVLHRDPVQLVAYVSGEGVMDLI